MDVAAATSVLEAATMMAKPISNTITNTKWPFSPKPYNSYSILSLNFSNNISISATATTSVTHCSPKPTRNVPKDSIFEPNPPPKTGLVLDLGPTGSWDSKEVGSPVVKRFLRDEEERWYMWYHGNSDQNPSFDSIGLAVSSNGVHWEREGSPVFKCSEDWWGFDTVRVRPSDVVVMSSAKVKASSSVYWLYYTGFSNEEVDFNANFGSSELNLEKVDLFRFDGSNGDGKVRFFKSLPGLAISQDGKNWARIEGEHHSGALFDVGLDKDWDSLSISSPQVVFHGNGDLRMYYHSFDNQIGQFCIGLARSRDGINWVKLGKVMSGSSQSSAFDELGVLNPCVVKNKKDGGYLMAYEGIGSDGTKSIGLAMSTDGLKDWRRSKAILTPSVGDCWDNASVGSPCLVQIDGDVDHQWRLYYKGIGSERKCRIGMAISNGDDITGFTRWTGFVL